MKKTLIIGNYPLKANIIEQYKRRDFDIVCTDSLDLLDNKARISQFDEIFILPSNIETSKIDKDNKSLNVLALLVEWCEKEQESLDRVCVHLLLLCRTSLDLIRNNGFSDKITKYFDVHPFTLEDEWSNKVQLDWMPITVQSEKYAHLVIFGFSERAEQTAISAALRAHFPNFVTKQKLRSRITIVSNDIEEKSLAFIEQYKYLFENSYYRFIDKKGVNFFHYPKYHKTRKDFVDIEWEFVSANVYDSLIVNKLDVWSSFSSTQVLTLALAYDDDERNVDEAVHLPSSVYSNTIPTYVYVNDDSLLASLILGEKLQNVVPIGMQNSGYDITLPLEKMAKTINHIYDQCYADNYDKDNDDWKIRFAVNIDRAERDKSWNKLSSVKRMSNIYNALTLETKMRSLGLEKEDWTKFYDITQREIDIMSQVEHNRWCVEELILGFRPCDDDERKQVENDIIWKEVLKKSRIHYDLCAYSELGKDATGKRVTIYDECLVTGLPLIAKSIADEEGGEK